MAQFFVPYSSEFVDVTLEVVELLSRLSDEYAIFLNVQFARQADVIVFAKHAAHLIEIKDKRGTIVIDQNGKWLLEEEGEPIVNVFAGREEDPITQAENTARALEMELKRIYAKGGKKFNGTVAPYVLVPFANDASRSNLSKIRGRWAWICTSPQDLLSSIAKRDERATVKKDFAFAPEDIKLVAQAMRMKPTNEINGVRIAERGATQSNVGSMLHPAADKQHPAGHLSQDGSRRGDQASPRSTYIGLSFLGALAVIGVVGLFVLSASAVLLWNQLMGLFSSSTPGSSSYPVVTPSPFASIPVAVPGQTSIPIPTISASTLVSAGGWSASRNGLILTVEKIEKGANRFRIWMRATNKTNDQLSLPLYGYFFAVDNLGNQYEADPFSSTFPSRIAPGATVSGFAEMSSQLDDDATSLVVTFTHIFGSLSVDSISVENIPVP